jgi:hypothetical protein
MLSAFEIAVSFSVTSSAVWLVVHYLRAPQTTLAPPTPAFGRASTDSSEEDGDR